MLYWLFNNFLLFLHLGKERFLLGGGGGGWAEASEGSGGSLVNFLLTGEGQTCFILNRGRVTVFLARKKLLHVASIFYIEAKLPVKDQTESRLSKLFAGVKASRTSHWGFLSVTKQ